jgi:hypothetical protein
MGVSTREEPKKVKNHDALFEISIKRRLALSLPIDHIDFWVFTDQLMNSQQKAVNQLLKKGMR